MSVQKQRDASVSSESTGLFVLPGPDADIAVRIDPQQDRYSMRLPDGRETGGLYSRWLEALLAKAEEEDRPAVVRSFGLEALRGAAAAGPTIRCRFRVRSDAIPPQRVEGSVYILSDAPDRQALLLLRDVTADSEQAQQRQRLTQYNIAIQNTYDELYELNVTRNQYRIIHHVPDKYVAPAETGCLHWRDRWRRIRRQYSPSRRPCRSPPDRRLES